MPNTFLPADRLVEYNHDWVGYLCMSTRFNIIERLLALLQDNSLEVTRMVDGEIDTTTNMKLTGYGIYSDFADNNLIIELDKLRLTLPSCFSGQQEASHAHGYAPRILFKQQRFVLIETLMESTIIKPLSESYYSNMLLKAVAERYLGPTTDKDIEALTQVDRAELIQALSTALAEDQPVFTGTAQKQVRRRRFNFA